MSTLCHPGTTANSDLVITSVWLHREVVKTAARLGYIFAHCVLAGYLLDPCAARTEWFTDWLTTPHYTYTTFTHTYIYTYKYKKQTDRNKYILPSSCHPKRTTKSISFSLFMRLVRICSDRKDRDQRLGELKLLLMARENQYLSRDRSIQRAKSIPRHK